MPRVSIAIPVFNGEAYLRESLACLESQTFRNIEVLVCDNHSTDATPDIASEFASRDPRFRHIRHPDNIGMMPNFIYGAQQAASPYFMWRAFDDLSDAGYVAALVATLEANPDAVLAAPAVTTINMDGSNERLRSFPALSGRAFLDTLTLLFQSRAGWFYGLWRREPLLRSMPLVLEAYPELWGNDHLTMLPFFLKRQIAFSPQARFIQRLKKTAGSPKSRVTLTAAQMQQHRQDFAACYSSVLEACGPGGAAGLALGLAMYPWRERRTYRLGQMVNAAMRHKGVQ